MLQVSSDNTKKTLNKLKEKQIIDEEYIYIRKNAFYNYKKSTSESSNKKTGS